MKLFKSGFIIFSAFILFGCKSNSTKNNFYSYTKTLDLWRFPLIEPFELISPTNSDDWFLVMKNPGFNNPDFYDSGEAFQLYNIDSVGIMDSIIVINSKNIYWPKLSGSYNSTFIMNTKTGKNLVYSRQHHYKEIINKFDELKINRIKLYPLKIILKKFQVNLSLPKEWPR